MDYFMGTSKESGPQKGLRVRIGPSRELLTTALVNGESVPHYIDSPYFQGHVLVRIKNFQGHKPAGAPEGAANEDYFGAHKRLFSVQVQGRFKHVSG